MWDFGVLDKRMVSMKRMSLRVKRKKDLVRFLQTKNGHRSGNVPKLTLSTVGLCSFPAHGLHKEPGGWVPPLSLKAGGNPLLALKVAIVPWSCQPLTVWKECVSEGRSPYLSEPCAPVPNCALTRLNAPRCWGARSHFSKPEPHVHLVSHRVLRSISHETGGYFHRNKQCVYCFW